MATGSSEARLEGVRVLVVEDEYFVADVISQALERCGASVLGPTATVEGARRALGRESPDCVLLDLNLRGELVFPLADELVERGVPFVMSTGYEAAVIPKRFAEVPRLEKPLDEAGLIAAVVKVTQITRSA